jgi:putative transposase
MKKLKITTKTAEEIKELIKSKESYQIGSRLVSILPLAMGQSSRKAQDLLLLSHNQICIWAKRFEKDGLEGLKDKPKSGRKPRIDEAQLKWFENLVLHESPTKYKFNTETWTAPLLVEVLLKECNLNYSDDTVYILLKKKLGLTHKKGKGFYKEADKEKRTEFVDDLKKTLRKSK